MIDYIREPFISIHDTTAYWWRFSMKVATKFVSPLNDEEQRYLEEVMHQDPSRRTSRVLCTWAAASTSVMRSGARWKLP